MTRLAQIVALVLLLLGQGAQAQSIGEQIGNHVFQTLFSSYGSEHSMLYLSGEYSVGLTLPRLSVGQLAPPRDHNRFKGVAFGVGAHLGTFLSLGVGAELLDSGNPMNMKPILGFVELKYRPLIDLPRLQLHARASMLTLYGHGSADADNYSLSIGWDWHKGVGLAGFNPSIGISYMPYTTHRSPDDRPFITYSYSPSSDTTPYYGATWSLFVRLAFTLN